MAAEFAGSLDEELRRADGVRGEDGGGDVREVIRVDLPLRRIVVPAA